MPVWVLSLIAVVGALVLRQGPDWADPDPRVISGAATVVDGDSLEISGRRIRLHGIDAPEGPQVCMRGHEAWACGRDATRYLVSLVAEREVTCSVAHRDQHGRFLSTCQSAGRELNREMVASGFAVAFGETYRSVEAEARSMRRGLWGSTFERPKEWREQNNQR
ncbi:MAG: thermonuclease family protein [Hyphomicrobiaceae bacterium]